jgi:acylphosphatase
MPPERLEAVVRGRVQGVGFRWFVLGEAARLGLTGWVANEPDGSVRSVAEGSREALEAFRDALRAGPPGAVVGRVDEHWLPATGTFPVFGVRSGAHRGD